MYYVPPLFASWDKIDCVKVAQCQGKPRQLSYLSLEENVIKQITPVYSAVGKDISKLSNS